MIDVAEAGTPWRRRRRGDGRRAFALPLLLTLASAWSCIVPAEPIPGEDGELENLAVEPPRDAVFRPDEDQRELRAPEAEVGGRLPGAFPETFPLPDGSTVFDLGDVLKEGALEAGALEAGAGDEPPTVEFVSLRLPLGAPAAREWLLREAQAAGWRVVPGGGALGDDAPGDAVPGGAAALDPASSEAAATGQTMTFRRGGQWIRAVIEPGRAAASSAARFEYPKFLGAAP